MQHNKFFEDATKAFSGAVEAALDARKNIEDSLNHAAKKHMESFGFVHRETVATVKDIATKARKENEILHAKIAELEKKLAGKVDHAAAAVSEKAKKVADKPVKAEKQSVKQSAPQPAATPKAQAPAPKPQHNLVASTLNQPVISAPKPALQGVPTPASASGLAGSPSTTKKS